MNRIPVIPTKIIIFAKPKEEFHDLQYNRKYLVVNNIHPIINRCVYYSYKDVKKCKDE
jgi:hypothetical protein